MFDFIFVILYRHMSTKWEDISLSARFHLLVPLTHIDLFDNVHSQHK